jgi:hypothetical protein
VLEDESGRRLRWLRFAGRLVALLAFVWLSLIVLGGLGVGPARHLPFGSALRISAAPPRLRALPDPRPASAADLVRAVPAAGGTPAAAPSARAPAATSPVNGTQKRVDASPGASKPKTKGSSPAKAKDRPAVARAAAAGSRGRSTAPHGHAATAKATAAPAADRRAGAARGQEARTATKLPAQPDKTLHAKKTTSGTTTGKPTPTTAPSGTGATDTSSAAPGRKKP